MKTYEKLKTFLPCVHMYELLEEQRHDMLLIIGVVPNGCKNFSNEEKKSNLFKHIGEKLASV